MMNGSNAMNDSSFETEPRLRYGTNVNLDQIAFCKVDHDGSNSNNSNDSQTQPTLAGAASSLPHYTSSNHHDSSSSPKNIDNDKNKFQVFLRIRPSTGTQQETTPEASTIEILDTTRIRTHPPASLPRLTPKEYQFHHVFSPTTTNQQDVYTRTAAPLVENLIQNDGTLGQSSLLFCYGITNAGKTYTIMGSSSSSSSMTRGTEEGTKDRGILPRALEQTLQLAQSYNRQVTLSQIEIYKEQVYDLLSSSSSAAANSTSNIVPDTAKALKIREHKGTAKVPGLSAIPIKSVEQGLQLLEQARQRRRTATNNLNHDSSRSHCICQLSVLSKSSNDSNGGDDKKEQERVNFWIVDLAGSERAKRTDAGLARRFEASQINMSLMTLMRCLMALRDSHEKERPPYRESKLTHLLMNHLQKSGRTSMIVNVHPCAQDYEESQHVLGYAAEAKRVVVAPNAIVPADASMQQIEYDQNGRKVLKQPKSKVGKLLQKLSPKLIRERKRKALAASSATNRTAAGALFQDNKKVKRSAKKAPKGAASAASKTVTGAAGTIDPKEVRRLRMALSVAQAECASLKQEKLDMKEQLENIEEQIRDEVSHEVHGQMQSMRLQYEEIIDNLKSKMRQHNITKSAKKQELRQTEMLEKLHEQESEMDRLRIEHETEMETLQVKHEHAIEKLQGELEALSQQNEELIAMKGKNDSDLIKELQTAKEQIRKLEKSKKELIQNYEQLLKDEDDDDDDEEPDDDGDDGSDMESEEEECDSSPTPKRAAGRRPEVEKEDAKSETKGDPTPVPKRVDKIVVKSERAESDLNRSSESEDGEEDDNDACSPTPKRSTDKKSLDQVANPPTARSDCTGNGHNEDKNEFDVESTPASKNATDAKSGIDVLDIDSSEDEEEEDGDGEEEEDDFLPTPKRGDDVQNLNDSVNGSVKSMEKELSPTRKRSTRRLTRLQARTDKKKSLPSSRRPLNTLSNATGAVRDSWGDDDDDNFDPKQWIQPKANVIRDPSTGEYLRPLGRKPRGAEEWDRKRGAWRKSIL